MKKSLIFFLLIGLFLFSVNAQQYVSFSTSEPGAPEINVLTSNAQSVSFEVTIPCIYTIDTVVNNVAFTRLFLPGGAAINPSGSPELPVLKYKVAIPICSATTIDYNVLSRSTMNSCWVYPVPEIVPAKNFSGKTIPVEQFTFNPSAYAQPHLSEQEAIISSSGSFRSQLYVEIMVRPIEFCPVTRQLSVIDKMEITLTFTNPQGGLRQNLGIFNKVASSAFINYEDDGISALINDKAFEKEGIYSRKCAVDYIERYFPSQEYSSGLSHHLRQSVF